MKKLLGALLGASLLSACPSPISPPGEEDAGVACNPWPQMWVQQGSGYAAITYCEPRCNTCPEDKWLCPDPNDPDPYRRYGPCAPKAPPDKTPCDPSVDPACVPWDGGGIPTHP